MEKIIPTVGIRFKSMYVNAGKEGIFTFQIPFKYWLKYMCEDFIRVPLKIINNG